jgi:subtilisin family serine protease
MKEYIVILKDGVDYDSFWSDIENTSAGLPHIPDRAVSIVNNRDVQPRMCHYLLTNEEAEELKSDARILAVEILPEQIGLFPVPPTTFGPSTANVTFTIPPYNASTATGNNVNWSLIRNSYSTNEYGNSTSTSSEYNYVLDGTGVDVVIMDSGIEYYHPEFQDANGNIRIVQYNWTGNLDVSPNSINFNDTEGHGTAAASLTAGLNYGWARNATIYPCKIRGTGAITTADGIDAIITWHNSKTNNRPTVVLAEFYNALIPSATLSYSVTNINYRNGGEVAAGGNPDPAKGMGPANNIVPLYDMPSGQTINLTTGQPFRVVATDTAIENMIAQGIIFIAAAGNNAHKIAAPADPDFQNYWTGTVTIDSIVYNLPSEWGYYNQGASPATTNSIVVGALAVGLNGSSKNYKASFSNAGYNVTVFAPGWDVRSAASNICPGYPNSPYFLNGSGESFKQTNFTGTSAACPQIAGISALYLQANPTATQAQVKSWLNNNSNISALYSSGSSDDYTNYESQWGGAGGVAFMPYNSANNFAISNGITLSNITLVNT